MACIWSCWGYEQDWGAFKVALWGRSSHPAGVEAAFSNGMTFEQPCKESLRALARGVRCRSRKRLTSIPCNATKRDEAV